MGKIFTGQTNLKLVLKTDVDITSATSLEIKYKKPNTATVLNLAATVLGTPTDGNIYYDFAVADNTILDTAGTWTFWACVTFADNRVARGETAILEIYGEGC